MREPTKSKFWVWPYRPLLKDLLIGGWKVMQMRCAIALAIIEQEVSKVGLANAHGVGEHGLEDGLKLAGRRTDDAQYLGRRRLLLQRLAEFARALLLSLKQSDVFNGDSRLIGKGR